MLGITRKDAAVPPVNVNSELMNNVTNVSKHTMNKRASSRRTSKTRSNQKKKRRRKEEEKKELKKNQQSLNTSNSVKQLQSINNKK